jgi:hypothetical protein
LQLNPKLRKKQIERGMKCLIERASEKEQLKRFASIPIFKKRNTVKYKVITDNVINWFI